MAFWPQFWMWFLLFGLVIFLGLAIAVSVGGLFDVRAMFKRIREQHDRQGD
ncbi:MAG: hypothetical protein ACE5I3_02930 [Phycisphaerae bacterium]